MSGATDQGWKILTHNLRPPFQWGKPLWVDGIDALPITLPSVTVDISEEECGAGWNYCATLADAVCITGLFRNGRPVRAFAVTTSGAWVARGHKRRATTLRVDREAMPEDWQEAFAALSAQLFPDHTAVMAGEQMAWWQALTQAGHNPARVEEGLRAALVARGLRNWELRRYNSTRATRATLDTWDDWDTWDTQAAWVARDAWDALVTQYAVRQGLLVAAPDRHTVGIRDAYAAGLAVALPVAAGVLGWAMREEDGAYGA